MGGADGVPGAAAAANPLSRAPLAFSRRSQAGGQSDVVFSIRVMVTPAARRGLAGTSGRAALLAAAAVANPRIRCVCARCSPWSLCAAIAAPAAREDLEEVGRLVPTQPMFRIDCVGLRSLWGARPLGRVCVRWCRVSARLWQCVIGRRRLQQLPPSCAPRGSLGRTSRGLAGITRRSRRPAAAARAARARASSIVSQRATCIFVLRARSVAYALESDAYCRARVRAPGVQRQCWEPVSFERRAVIGKFMSRVRSLF